MEKKEDFIIPEDVAEWIGLRKSQYLSDLIMNIKEDDFKIEEFTRFDDFIPSTIEQPDRVLEETVDGYDLRTFIRTYQEGVFFHQMVLGMMIPDQSTGKTIYIPILAFVTRKDDMVKIFSTGQTINRPTFN